MKFKTEKDAAAVAKIVANIINNVTYFNADGSLKIFADVIDDYMVKLDTTDVIIDDKCVVRQLKMKIRNEVDGGMVEITFNFYHYAILNLASWRWTRIFTSDDINNKFKYLLAYQLEKNSVICSYDIL